MFSSPFRLLSFVLAAVTLGSVNALPTSRPNSGSSISDFDVLNFALTLEHLEQAFYRSGLQQYDMNAFTSLGYSDFARNRVAQIAAHEGTHVNVLTTALSKAGAPKIAQECQYEFNFVDVPSFLDMASMFEAIGSSAYAGAAKFIREKTYLTVAASILATEARHSAWYFAVVQQTNPWASAFETPLSFSQAYTLASPYIKSCPSSNPRLPARKFPKLRVVGSDGGFPRPGQRARLYFTLPDPQPPQQGGGSGGGSGGGLNGGLEDAGDDDNGGLNGGLRDSDDNDGGLNGGLRDRNPNNGGLNGGLRDRGSNNGGNNGGLNGGLTDRGSNNGGLNGGLRDRGSNSNNGGLRDADDDDSSGGGLGYLRRRSLSNERRQQDESNGDEDQDEQDDSNDDDSDGRKRMRHVRRYDPDDQPLYAAIMIGLDTIYVDVNVSKNGKRKEMTFPQGLCGPIFVMITNDQGKTDDEHTVAGPVYLRFPCDSRGQPVDPWS